MTDCKSWCSVGWLWRGLGCWILEIIRYNYNEDNSEGLWTLLKLRMKSVNHSWTALTRSFRFTGRDAVIPFILYSQQARVSHCHKAWCLGVIEDTSKVNVLLLKLEVREKHLAQQVDVILRIILIVSYDTYQIHEVIFNNIRFIISPVKDSLYLRYEGAPCKWWLIERWQSDTANPLLCKMGQTVLQSEESEC